MPWDSWRSWGERSERMGRDSTSERARTRAGTLLVTVLVVALGAAAAHRLAPTVRPAGRVDPDVVHRVDLNHADPAEIAVLPGIGDVLAARIVDSRERHGRFAEIGVLERVHGIGPRTIERIRPHVVCEPETP